MSEVLTAELMNEAVNRMDEYDNAPNMKAIRKEAREIFTFDFMLSRNVENFLNRLPLIFNGQDLHFAYKRDRL